jgi:hypothetical protein
MGGDICSLIYQQTDMRSGGRMMAGPSPGPISSIFYGVAA